MRNIGELVNKLALTKDLVADQTTTNIQEKLNTTNLGFDVVEGYGYVGAASSSGWVYSIGGFDDQRIVSVVKYVAPSAPGNEEIGCMLRCLSLDSPNASYYYARADAGDAKITKVVDGAFTTLTQTPFNLPADELCTIDFQVVGSQLDASFTAATPGTVNLSTNDTDIPGGGLPGVRSQSSTIWCRSSVITQL
jgi:hypothetical protein